MKIGNIEIENNLFLAPMAGITNVAFRALASEFGAGVTYTEMVSAKGLFYDSKNTFKLLKTDECEKIVAVQLFGNESEVFEKVIKSGALDKFDIIDINMGCPAPKIVKNNEGSALMKDFALAQNIIETCVKSTTKPITVKFRKGFDKDVAVEFAKMCEKAGAAAITIHGRLRKEFFGGEVDREIIAKIVEAVKIPVIANGDIVDITSFKEMEKTKADAFMIGRATMFRPWIFKELLEDREINVSRFEVCTRYYELLKKHDILNLAESKAQFVWLIKGLKNAGLFKQKIFKAESFDECLALVKEVENDESSN